ncbi:MAG: leucine-rich repeat protein [Clostridia bacterium]|nr:leucine-rich repeat protein [Clostridia bacterium]
MKKKLLLVVSMLAILMCLLAISVSAAEYTDANGIKYTTNSDGTAQVAKNPDFTGTEAIIAEKITVDGVEYTVTSVAGNAFDYLTTLTTIYFPPTITKITGWTFRGASNMEKIYIDFENLTYVGSQGFTTGTNGGGYNNVKEDIIIYATSEYGKETPTQTTVANFASITNIGQASFQGLNVQKIIIGENVTSFGIQSFRGSAVTELVLNCSKVDTLPNYSFDACKNLVTIDARNTEFKAVGGSVFSKCTLVKEIRIDMSQVVSVGANAFCFATQYDSGNSTVQWYNHNGEKVVDLTSLETIGGGGQSGAFASSNLGSAKIIWPKAIKSIADQCFRKCNINQPIYLNAEEGANLTLTYWAFNGNAPQLFVLGPGITTFKCRLEAQCTLVSLANSVEFTDSEVFNVSGSQFYGRAYSGTDISTKSKVTVNTISSGIAVNYGACGIDCNVTLTSDGSNVVISTPVHTWNEGIVDETKCPIGAVLKFDCNYCDATKAEGEGTDHSHTVAIIVYGDNNFFAKGTKTYKCANEECTSKLAEGTEVSPIFTSLGYSKTEVGTKAVRQGFAINQDALKEYNNSTDNKIIGFGVLAASKKALNGETEVFENGALNNTRVAYVDFGARTFDIMEIKISGLEGSDETNGDYVDLELYCCGYYLVQNNTSVDSYYASEGTVTESLSATVTFNSVK